MTRLTSRLLNLSLAAGLLVGCQTAPGSAPPFGIDVTNRAGSADALPQELTGGAPTPAGSYVENQLIVQLAPQADPAIALAGFERLAEVTFANRYVGIQLPDGMTLTQAHELLRQRPGVMAMHLNGLNQTSTTYQEPNDLGLGYQWAHRRTEAVDYWKRGETVDASNVIVAVLDTGIDFAHPEFRDSLGNSRIVSPQNFVVDDPTRDPSLDVEVDATDGNSHGTHCAGIIGALGNNGVGVAGVVWDVNLMPVKTLGTNGSGSDLGIFQGFMYALGEDVDGPPDELLPDGNPKPFDRKPYVDYLPEAKKDARVRVISMSLGTKAPSRSPIYAEAFKMAHDMGIVVVVAAGNDGDDVKSPAVVPNALAVSSTNAYVMGDRIWEWLSGFSNRGDRIDLSAPGGNILSTFPTYQVYDANGNPKPRGYASISGTSMATPYVAGTAALLIAKRGAETSLVNGDFTTAIKHHLYATSDDLGAPGKDPKFGHGRVNVLKALTATFPTALTP